MFPCGPWQSHDGEERLARPTAEAESRRILCLHIIGPYAWILIQEVLDAMTSGEGTDVVQRSMQIPPSVTELIPSALSSIGNAVWRLPESPVLPCKQDREMRSGPGQVIVSMNASGEIPDVEPV